MKKPRLVRVRLVFWYCACVGSRTAKIEPLHYGWLYSALDYSIKGPRASYSAVIVLVCKMPFLTDSAGLKFILRMLVLNQIFCAPV